MSTRRMTSINTTALYLIMAVVIIVAFLLLGGGHWMQRMVHGNMSMGIANWNWAQILISLAIGFLLGLVVAKKK